MAETGPGRGAGTVAETGPGRGPRDRAGSGPGPGPRRAGPGPGPGLGCDTGAASILQYTLLQGLNLCESRLQKRTLFYQEKAFFEKRSSINSSYIMYINIGFFKFKHDL